MTRSSRPICCGNDRKQSEKTGIGRGDTAADTLVRFMTEKPLQCAKCGACTVVCPAFLAGGRESLSARGRLHLLERLDPAQASTAYAEILSQCLLCGACRSVCSRRLDPPARFIAARKQLERSAGHHVLLRAITRKALANPTLLATIAGLGHPLLDRLPADSGLRLRLGLPPEGATFPPLPEMPRKKAAHPALAFFPGCYATHLHKEIRQATERLAETFTGKPPLTPKQHCCCGLAAENGGDTATARRLAIQNINAFAENSLPILTSCASCYSQLRRYPQLFEDDPEWQEKAQTFANRLLEFSTFATQAMETDPSFRFAGPAKARTVVYHDPCHLRFQPQLTDPPRKILRTIPNLRLIELPDGPQCCGQGGLFHLAQPELAGKIRDRLLNQLEQAAPDLVTTTCSGCLIHIRQGVGHDPARPEVHHLAILLTELL
ncbi:MAG: (Fe-S)-binding protein [Desulfobulbaceae bacterium]|nr:(Fe-S)-binding protein [Desulfobulbaceae bacterium]HIJ91631.1 (Fe-S)-binding protein [Deltaproteobacteria bacterium]